MSLYVLKEGVTIEKLYGVNLGNWLVLEKWMSPALFSGISAGDETDLCAQLGEAKAARLKAHRDTFITAADFGYIRERGLNAVRIPVPHFIFGDCEPYVGCAEYLDAAFEWAQAAGLKILIDLHTAPDSQNGFDNGGICGVCKWHTKEENIQRTLDVLERLAARYKDHPALYGVELLNEPISEEVYLNTRKQYPPSDPARAEGSCAVPIEVLFDFYERGYSALRRHLDADRAVVLHDGFRLKAWKDFMRGPEYRNVVLDAHLYVGLSAASELPPGAKAGLADYLRLALTKHMDNISEMRRYFPVIVGEWSLGQRPAERDAYTPLQMQYSYRALADAQLFAWESVSGWFFWSYKTLADTPGWNMRDCISRGWLPDNFIMGK
jgi:hypothetical protein